MLMAQESIYVLPPRYVGSTCNYCTLPQHRFSLLLYLLITLNGRCTKHAVIYQHSECSTTLS